jgi:hypothetical protein
VDAKPLPVIRKKRNVNKTSTKKIMKNLKILNELNILQKVTLGVDNSILFFFGDTPNWNVNTIFDVSNPKDYYQVIEIKVEKELSNLYCKVKRYAGEQMFLQLEDDKINIWEGEISEYEQYWGTFDEIEDFKHTNYRVYQQEKSAEDWKTEYMKLRKNYHSLYEKKSFQLKEYRLALQKEFKAKIDTRVEHLKNRRHKVDDKTLDQVYYALNDEHSGYKISSVVDFIFE